MISINTGYREWDEFWPKIKSFLDGSHTEIDKNWSGGDTVKGYRTPDCAYLWLRDNVHMMKGSVWLLPDPKSLIEFFIENQKPDGSYFDFLNLDGEMVRVPTEADLEYLAVLGVYRAWLASGDTGWMAAKLPALRHGLEYMTSDPWRWDETHRMPKRACTIDTWDFDIRDDLTELHWPGKIDDKTHFGIMHGDVSGLYYAYKVMEEMLDSIKEKEEAKYFQIKARELRERANDLLWNGYFYRHRYPLDDFRIEGVDEDEQLSLSNTYDMNRKLPTPTMARSIIREYYKRRVTVKSFAEWFSIEPAFPEGVFGDEKLKPGVYVNGGIMPLVGGELSRAAFRYGYPTYGVDILQRYFSMIDKSGEAYLWYFRDGSPATKEASTSPEAYPTDGWGSTAMLAALIEGLVGVRSGRPGFETAWLEPHWADAGVDEASVHLKYPSSEKSFQYTYKKHADKNVTEMTIKADPLVSLHVGFPERVDKVEAWVGKKKIDVKIEEWELGKATAFCDEIEGDLRLIIFEK